MELVILAAGEGNRLRPITLKTPKALIKLNKKPLIQYTIDQCAPFISKIIFVINDSLGYKIKEFFGDSYKKIPIQYVIQNKKTKKGTFYALKKASKLLKGNLFAVCQADDLYKNKDIENIFKNKTTSMCLVYKKMPWFFNTVCIKNNFINKLQKHEKTENEIEGYIVTGFYFLTKKVFKFNPVILENGEGGLPQTLFANLNKYKIQAKIISDWIPVNNKKDLIKARKFIKNNSFI